MILWYDREGKPMLDTAAEVGNKKWLKAMTGVEELLGTRSYKIVKQDYTPKKKYWVSTVWLGMDHSFGWFSDEPNPHPIIFETMVFSAKLYKAKVNKLFPKGYSYRKDFEQDRYETEAQALEGHKKLLAKYTKKEKDETRKPRVAKKRT